MHLVLPGWFCRPWFVWVIVLWLTVDSRNILIFSGVNTCWRFQSLVSHLFTVVSRLGHLETIVHSNEACVEMISTTALNVSCTLVLILFPSLLLNLPLYFLYAWVRWYAGLQHMRMLMVSNDQGQSWPMKRDAGHFWTSSFLSLCFFSKSGLWILVQKLVTGKFPFSLIRRRQGRNGARQGSSAYMSRNEDFCFFGHIQGQSSLLKAVRSRHENKSVH